MQFYEGLIFDLIYPCWENFFTFQCFLKTVMWLINVLFMHFPFVIPPWKERCVGIISFSHSVVPGCWAMVPPGPAWEIAEHSIQRFQPTAIWCKGTALLSLVRWSLYRSWIELAGIYVWDYDLAKVPVKWGGLQLQGYLFKVSLAPHCLLWSGPPASSAWAAWEAG